MYLKWKEFSSSCIVSNKTIKEFSSSCRVSNKTIKNMDVFHGYCNKGKAMQFSLLTWIAVCVLSLLCMIKSSSEDEEGKNL
jgi:hypothetical protein